MNKSSHHHRLFKKKTLQEQHTTWYGRLGTVRYIWPKGDFEIFSLVLASNPSWWVQRGCQLVEIGVGILGIVFFGEKRLDSLLSRERQDWLKKLIDLWNIYIYTCVRVCSHYAICESFILLYNPGAFSYINYVSQDWYVSGCETSPKMQNQHHQD